jgi:ABC-2 type transport system ATP-binding protein
MLALIKRLAGFDINVIVSSHVLTDIEQTCDWVVMLDAGQLLRSGPLQGFEKLGTVLVEVLDQAESVANRIRAKGIEVTVDGRRLIVGPGDDRIEQMVVHAVAETGAGLVRMIRGSASLEDMFMSREPVT